MGAGEAQNSGPQTRLLGLWEEQMYLRRPKEWEQRGREGAGGEVEGDGEHRSKCLAPRGKWHLRN